MNEDLRKKPPQFKLKKIDTENGRFYMDQEGNFYPSVTSKIERVLAKGEGFYHWLTSFDSYEKVKHITSSKADRGTNVHEACEKLAQGEEIEVDEDTSAGKRIKNFVNFINDHNPKLEIIDTEFTILNKKLEYAGRADLVGLMHPNSERSPNEKLERFIIDLKTSKRVYPSHELQLSFYKAGLEENNYPVDGIGVLVLGEDKYTFKKIEYDYDYVEAANKLYPLVGPEKPDVEDV